MATPALDQADRKSLFPVALHNPDIAGPPLQWDGSTKQQVKGAELQAEGKAQKHLDDAEQAAKNVRHVLIKATSKQI